MELAAPAPLDTEPNPNFNQTAPALMLDAVAAEAARRVDEFRPRELVVLIWALAASRRPASELLGAAAPMVTARAPHLDIRALVAMAWAYATAAEGQYKATHDVLAAAATRRLSRPRDRVIKLMSQQELSTMRSALHSPDIICPLELRVEAIVDPWLRGKPRDEPRAKPKAANGTSDADGFAATAARGDTGAPELTSWHALLLRWLAWY